MRTKMLKVVGVLMSVALALFSVGCEGTIKSPISGNEVTAAELVAEEAKADRDAAVLASKEKARAEQRIRTAKLEAEREAAAIAQTADLAAADAARQLRLIELGLGTELESATADVTAALDQLATAARFREDSVGDALEAIAAKESALTKVLGMVTDNPVVKTGLASVGVDSSLITGGLALLLGGGAVSVAAKRAKKREDENWDDAAKKTKADADEARAREHTAWDEAKREETDAKMRKELDELRLKVMALSVAPKP